LADGLYIKIRTFKEQHYKDNWSFGNMQGLY